MRFTGLVLFVVGGFLIYWAFTAPRADGTSWINNWDGSKNPAPNTGQ